MSETIYDYQDETGELIYQVVRQPNKDFKQRRPDGKGGWIWDLKGVNPTLYRLPEIRQAIQKDESVFVPEGEKDCNNLAKLALAATTNSGGAGKWQDSFSDHLVGADVVILPDNDEAGHRHADKVARSLQGKAKSIKVVDLPGLPEKGDVSDWLAAGGTKDALLRMVAEAPEWAPESEPAGDAFRQALAEIEAKLKDNPDLTPDASLYAPAIMCLAKADPVMADIGIKSLVELLKRLGVTGKAIRDEIKRTRKNNPGLGCDSVTDGAQNGTGQGDGTVTDGVTDDRPVYDITALEEQAATVLNADDTLHLVGIQIKSQGYGGDLKAPLIVYLAFTSRLLKMRTGSMPVHLLLHGPASAGKSYTIKVVIQLLPPEAYHTIDAGSPRVLIYDPAPLKHRALIFGEADSLPAGEDNPAASAVRNLTQDGQLHYSVVTQNTSNTGYVVHEVVKPGPTVLITTAVRKLGHQLMTRLFTLDVADDAKQVKAALATQARMETSGISEVDPELIAFQLLLQAQAPWDVTVPFAEALAREISRATDAPRILRDFQRVLSLIKSVTVLRHRHRQRDDQGRLVAEIEDYRTVYDLVADMYAATTSGASKAVRDVVGIIQEIKSDENIKITYSVLAKKLGVHRQIAKRRADQALRLGWLVNNESRKGHTADLVMGEPMPPATGLPEPVTLETAMLQACDSECDKLTEDESLAVISIEDTVEAVCHTVTPVTDHDLMEVRI